MHVESSTREEKTKGDRSAFLNMLYLKTIDRESSLNDTQSSLRNIQMQIVKHQITVGNLGEYKTELVGEIKSTTIVGLQKKRNYTVVAGIAGLIMSLFIAFFMEYIEGAKSRRKGQGQG
jgi:Na+/H+-translocating membrane pyrophosphatase